MALPKNVNLGALLQVLDSTNGRDKVSKIIQYGAKVLAAHLISNPAHKDLAGRLSKLDKAAANARKLFRLGKHIPPLIKVNDLVASGNMSVNNLLVIGQNLGLSTYFFFDHIVWFLRIGLLVNMDEPKYAKWSSLGWMVGLLCAIAIDLIGLVKYAMHYQNESPEWHKQQRLKFVLNFTKNFGDLFVALSGAKLATYSDMFLGIAGSASAWIGLYESWPALKK